MFWQSVTRPIMFCLPAEWAHYVAMAAFSNAARFKWVRNFLSSRNTIDDPRLESTVFGLKFKNPIGLAAGFDKDGRWYNELASLGFSHIEIGTITGQAQPGNPKPRLFRLPVDRAIVNRMGFNNQGSEVSASLLQASIQRKLSHQILGINIGKTKTVPLEDATSDYLLSLERLFDFADYITVNVSSPNTPGLRQLQDREPLIELLSSIQESNEQLANAKKTSPKPVLLKIAPDLNEDQLHDIASIASTTKLAGIIATNTTIAREPLATNPAQVSKIGAGGLSGQPLTQRSREVVRTLYRATEGQIPIIGVGGIMNGEDAWRMILAGATLIQIYTGFIYGGPRTVRSMNSILLEKLCKNNLSSLKEAVGGEGKFD